MSKSLGNSVDPQEVCKKYGADILRLWVASVEYTQDVRVSDAILSQCAEAYRKIRNTFRFLLGNLSDFNPDLNRVPYEKMSEVDQYMECSLSKWIEKVTSAYESYQFDEVYRSSLNYMTNQLSAFYLDFTKDVLYIESKNNPLRRSIQTVFYDHLSVLVRYLTPIIPFTTEEVFSYMPKSKDLSKESVYLNDLPKPIQYPNCEELLNKYQEFMTFRNDVLKAIEVARNEKVIGKSMSAKLVVYPTEKTKKLLQSLHADLKTLFIVSEFVLSDQDIEGLSFESGKILVTAREGIVCDRCWQVVDHVNEDGICERCAKVVKEQEV